MDVERADFAGEDEHHFDVADFDDFSAGEGM